MRELPKFVVKRLRGSTPLAEHPDADVLTAFAEHSLPAPERALVLEHIARCGDCREVIALALPATEAACVGGKVTFGIHWRWPVLRGVAAFAGLLLVAAIGIRQFRHRAPASMMVARNVEQKQIVTPPVANKPEVVAPLPQTAASQGIARREGEPSLAGSAHRPAQPLSGTLGALGFAGKSTVQASGSAGGIGSGVRPQQGAKMAMAVPPRDLTFDTSAQGGPLPPSKQLPTQGRVLGGNPPPAASQMVEVQAQSQVATTESQAATAELRAPAESVDNVVRAKPAATNPSAAPAANSGLAAPNPLDVQETQETPTAKWTISSMGTLQRSFDGGRTWQDVNMNAKPGLYAGSMQMAARSTSQLSKDQESKEVAKKLAKAKTRAPMTSPVPVFRALAIIGNHVWAGASGGILYHSADGGTFWTTIIPSSQGVTLSGDIVRIDFSDSLHGTITTTNSESWTTADGGQSWQKQ